MQPTVKAITLRDYLKVVFRHKIIFFVLPIAILIPVYYTLQMMTPMYTASVKMLVQGQKPTEADYYKGILSQSITADHSELVTSNIVLTRVVEALKLYEIPIDDEKRFAPPLKAALIEKRMKQNNLQFSKLTSEEKRKFFFGEAMGNLRSSINAAPIPDTNFFKITVAGYDPRIVPLIANSLSRSYVIFDLEQQIQEFKLKFGEKNSTVIQLENHIDELKKALHGRIISDIEAIGPASVKIIEQAQHGQLGRGLNKSLLLVAAFFAGILLSIIFAFILEHLDQTLKSQHDIESYLKIPFLGSIPGKKSNKSSLISRNNSGSRYTQSLQDLSDQIYLLMNDKKIKTILISDAEGNEETINVLINIAAYLAGNPGQKVLIIDADLRKSSISKILNIPNDKGLSNVLEKEVSFEDAVQGVGLNLNVLPSGNSMNNPAALLSSSVMPDIINKAKEVYGLIFINCADIKNYTDSVLLSSVVDGIILLVSEGKVRRQVISQALLPLQGNKSNLIGVVLNNRKYAIPELIYRIS